MIPPTICTRRLPHASLRSALGLRPFGLRTRVRNEGPIYFECEVEIANEPVCQYLSRLIATPHSSRHHPSNPGQRGPPPTTRTGSPSGGYDQSYAFISSKPVMTV